MKKLYAVLIALAAVTTLSAQNPTTYFMEGSTFRSQWNPAFAPDRGYVNIPVLGGIQIGTQGNLAVDKVLIPQNGQLTTIFSGSVPATFALEELSEMNSLGVGTTINIIGFGRYARDRRTFWSADLNIRTDIDLHLPYGLFDFMKNGNSADISGLGISGESYLEAAFSYSFPITEKLYLGVRGKFLAGAARFRMNFDRFYASLGEDRWYADATGTLEVAGLAPGTKTTEAGTLVYDMDNLVDKFKVPAGYGFGVDLGVTYDLLPQLQLSASVNDLGFMCWSKGKTSIGETSRTIEFTGVEIDEEGNATQPSFDLEELELEVRESKGITKMLRASVNLGGEYAFLNRRIGVGLFYNIRFREYETLHNLTLSGNFRPLHWLHISGSYTFVDNRAHAVGLGLNICPGGINLFLGTDVLLSRKTPQWIPVRQSLMNYTFGLGIPLGPRGERHARR
ncbi:MULTISPECIES: DUF5723 family protein [Rikenellaceae]|uniref:DUF5723 family protein n=1 Tax=Rikenellaceae TaxID=171550 RepID=UPI002629875A|nr:MULTISPECIES: DUF5723 family protein [Rikenellaceae]